MEYFKPKKKLLFLDKPWIISNDTTEFKMGTCRGLFRRGLDSYIIISLINDQSDNNHLDNVLEWFKRKCKNDNMNLRVLEVWDLYIEKMLSRHGFIVNDNGVFIKYYKK
jgi:hypothetical protein